MSLDDLRSFALGELGWTIDRWLHATLYEFNTAAGGYWRRWERGTGWLMREVVFAMIAGNPNIKKEDKPKSSREIMPLSMDRKEKREPDKVTEEDIKIFEMLQFNKD